MTVPCLGVAAMTASPGEAVFQSGDRCVVLGRELPHDSTE